MKSSILAKVSGKNSEPRRAIVELESVKNVGSYSRDNTIQKNGIKIKTQKGHHGVSDERGAQCATTTASTYDNSESHVMLGRYQPCASASTFNPGVKVEGGARDTNRTVQLFH